MGAYENGVTTRKIILDACEKLFYEKGYHNTSYDDICRKAHVNRGSIYYHFKEKENIRYEVLWEMTTRCYEDAKKYCENSDYKFMLGTYIFWGKTLSDAKLRRFFLEYYGDYPVYTEKNPGAYYYKLCNQNMFGAFFPMENIKPLALATVYGNVYGAIRLIDSFPERYTLLEIFQHIVTTGMMIWGIPKEKADEIWENMLIYAEKIPEEEIAKPAV